MKRDTAGMPSKRPAIHQASDIHELLLQSKAANPIAVEHLDELRRIAKLDVSQYSEADVRAEIIDPIVRVLGYQKETYFSLQREKHLKVLDRDLFIDYKMTLWSEAFWVIEAKKVKRRALRFTAAELQQALQYAAHPEINAALVVLCDGRVFEVYDREESVSEPAVRVAVKDLPEQFRVLQMLLAPWQAWFFQKRRVLRLIDKVLDYEINPGRLAEFRETIERRIEQKRGKVIENWRKVRPVSNDRSERNTALRKMSVKDLVEAEFFLNYTEADMHEIAKILVEKARPGGFEVMYQIFPDLPRDMNDHFVGLALRTLIEFDACGRSINWLPTWLAGSVQRDGLRPAIERLIELGLTTFDGDKGRKFVLQYAASARRVAKIVSARIPALAEAGQTSHALLRFTLDELHSAQYMSSPAGHSIGMLDGVQAMLTSRYVADCMDDRQKFSLARAETLLCDQWQLERKLLGDGSAYWTQLAGRRVEGEFGMTEHSWVDYDSLGHTVLCVIAKSPKWADYALKSHAEDIQRLVSSGSWKARDLLGLPSDTPRLVASDEEMAQRFFYGDVELFKHLRAGYANRPRT